MSQTSLDGISNFCQMAVCWRLLAVSVVLDDIPVFSPGYDSLLWNFLVNSFAMLEMQRVNYIAGEKKKNKLLHKKFLILSCVMKMC